MAMRPTFFNAVVAWLFIIGSACFVLGSVPAYLDAVGGVADGVTFVVGSIFFTAASLGQLLQAQTPAMSLQTHRSAKHRSGSGCGAGVRTTRTGSRPSPSFRGPFSSTSARPPR